MLNIAFSTKFNDVLLINAIKNQNIFILVILLCIINYTIKVIQMPMTETKIKQWGNSLALIIPKEIAKREELNVGDIVKVEISKGKRIDAFGMFRGIPKFKEEKEDHDELW